MTTLDKIIREGKSFGNYVLIVMCLVGLGIALGLLAGCAPAPVPFVEGDIAPAPLGCVEGRARGVDC